MPKGQFRGKEIDDCVMRHIEESFARFGKPPTYRDMQDRAGVPSLRTIQQSLGRLERDGYITRPKKYHARPIKLTKKRYFI